MRSEIRGLPAGIYDLPKDAVSLRVKQTDKGVIIEVIDDDADIFYSFTVNEMRKVFFEWGQASSPQ